MPICSINPGSLPAHLETVITLPASIIGAQETKLTAEGQTQCKLELKKHGWIGVFGDPIENPRACGGVCILSSTGQLRAYPRRAGVSEELWASKRFCHAVMMTGHKSDVPLHVVSFYGFTNAGSDASQRESNEHLLSLLFVYLAELGDVPIIILADLNTTRAASAALGSALACHQWFDCAEIQSLIDGTPPGPTCHVHETSAGSRIDHILINTVAAQHFRGYELLAEPAIPVHSPIRVLMDFNIANQMGQVIKRPRAFPLEWEKMRTRRSRAAILGPLPPNRVHRSGSVP